MLNKYIMYKKLHLPENKKKIIKKNIETSNLTTSNFLKLLSLKFQKLNEIKHFHGASNLE